MEHNETEMVTVESGTVALLNKSEIDQQIATAHRYPRSIKKFMGDAETLVTLSEEVAEECVYALPRKEKNKETGSWETKTIEGPSARFAEIVVSCWGNARAGARVVSDEGEFVTAQGVMHDLEKNVAITYEVQRRITGRNGQRFSADMIGVTANAASSIALRNAILKVIPKALWNPLYLKARQVIMGDATTLSNRRLAALANLQKRGVSGETVFEHFGVAGIEEITLDHLATLRGYLTAIKEGDSTVEQIFGKDDPAATGKPAVTMPKAKPPAPAAGAPDGGAASQGPAPAAAPAASSPTPAPAPAPAPAGVDPDTGELFRTPTGAQEAKPPAALATEGERQLILRRARSAGVEMASLMEQTGLTGLPADLAGLTKDGFIALLDVLKACSA